MSFQNDVQCYSPCPDMDMHDTFTPLGFRDRGLYTISAKCEDVLDEVLFTTDHENIATRSVRQQWGSQGIMIPDLVSVVKAVKTDAPSVFQKSVRTLPCLPQPVHDELASTTDSHTTCHKERACDIDRLHTQSIRACDVEFLQKMEKEIVMMLNMAGGGLLTDAQCENVNDCLILLRNMFHKSNDQFTVLRRVFQSGIQRLVFTLATHKQRERWSIVVLELVSLFFTKHTNTLLQKPEESHDDLDLFTRDLGQLTLEKGLKKNSSIFTDSAYSSTDMDRGSSGESRGHDVTGTPLSFSYTSGDGSSTCSNASYVDWDESCAIDGSSSLDDDDILENSLMEFAMQFIQTSFSPLVGSLMDKLKSSSPVVMDTCKLCSLISFFLNLSNKRKIVPGNVELLLNKDLITYLITEAVRCSLRLSVLKRKMETCLFTEHKLEETMSALCLVFEFFLRLSGDDSRQTHLDDVTKHLVSMADLGDIFLILLSNYDSRSQTRFCLQKIVEANHSFVLLLENWSRRGFMAGFNMVSHVRQFFTYDIMLKYGVALETFETNTAYFNNCILTLMFHAAGYYGELDVLQQLPILKTFVEIKEKHILLSDDFRWFMDSVMKQFLSLAEENPLVCAQMLAEADIAHERHHHGMDFNLDSIPEDQGDQGDQQQ